MDRPRILLCPQFTEVEWTIAPELAEWADVATFDPPGVGDEQASGGKVTQMDRAKVVGEALAEADRRGWDSYFVVGDAWGTATAIGAAIARPSAVRGVALGHASVDYGSEGERPAINGELVAAMTQLLQTNFDAFVRYGLTQFTQGGWDEETSGRIVERFPEEGASEVWGMYVETPTPVAQLLEQVDAPLLLAKHDGCLVFTPEGYEDLVAAFPDAHVATVDTAPSASKDFAAALRDFCERVLD